MDSGARVLCEIYFPELPNHVVLKAWVLRWRPAVPRLGVRAGADLALDSSQDKPIEYLLGVARGTRAPGRRRATRLPVEWPMQLHVAGSTHSVDARLHEISVSGAVIRPPQSLAKGTELILAIQGPGAASPMEIASLVTETFDDYAIVTFQVRDAGGIRRLRELVRRFRAPG